jgi:hypothetical protein
VADRDEAQRRREEARRQRRESQASPEEPQDQSEAGLDDDSHAGLKQAAKVAAAGAAVGAAVGAALASRDGDSDEDAETGEEEAREPAAGRVEPSAPDEPDESEQPEPEVAPEPEAEAPEPRERHEPAEPEPPAHGASPDETVEVVRRARQQLQALQGRDAESVSSLERTAQGWKVALDVVELRRVPDSTDVLASYELVLDEDMNVISFTRGRRYYRSQADRDGRA